MKGSLHEAYNHLTAMWRRRWRILGVAWFLCFVGWAIVALLPAQFESSARVYADTEDVLDPLLKDIAVESNLDRQLDVMRRTLLSRPNLGKVVRTTDLDHRAKTAMAMEELIEDLAGRIDIVLERSNLFSISFEDTNPELAQRVVQSLLTIFIEGNLGQKRREMDAARRFIDQQVAGYERQLDLADAKLAKFKQDNRNLLPGSGGYTVLLQRAGAALTLAQASHAEAETRREELRRQLGEVPRFIEMLATEFGGPPSDPEIRMLELQQQIGALRMHYTDKHPNVVVALRRLADLRREMEADAKAAAVPVSDSSDGEQPNGRPARSKLSVSNPVYEQIKLQLVQEAANMATFRSRIARSRAKVEKLDRQINYVPMVEAQFLKLTRDYKMLRDNYENLLERAEQAKISQDRDVKGQRVQFRIIDPAEVPTIPSGPDRPLFLSAVLIVAIGAALAFGWVLASMDETFFGVHRLKQAFGMPVLGCISLVSSTGRHGLRVLGYWGFGTACLALFAGFGVLLAIELSVGLNSVVVVEVAGNGISRLIDLTKGVLWAPLAGFD